MSIPGTFVHHDLTVADAPGVRDFYAGVVGWAPSPLSMEQHDDYVMSAADGTPVAGVCRAVGENADLPPQWLAYVAVPDVPAAAQRCVQLGGEVVAGPKGTGPGSYVVVRDPAGAVLALTEPGE